jgi:hypothetical protein
MNTELSIIATDSANYKHTDDVCKTFDTYCDRCGLGIAAAVYFKSRYAPNWSVHTYTGRNTLHRTELGAGVALLRAIIGHRVHECDPAHPGPRVNESRSYDYNPDLEFGGWDL